MNEQVLHKFNKLLHKYHIDMIKELNAGHALIGKAAAYFEYAEFSAFPTPQ